MLIFLPHDAIFCLFFNQGMLIIESPSGSSHTFIFPFTPVVWLFMLTPCQAWHHLQFNTSQDMTSKLMLPTVIRLYSGALVWYVPLLVSTTNVTAFSDSSTRQPHSFFTVLQTTGLSSLKTAWKADRMEAQGVSAVCALLSCCQGFNSWVSKIVEQQQQIAISHTSQIEPLRNCCHMFLLQSEAHFCNKGKYTWWLPSLTT